MIVSMTIFSLLVLGCSSLSNGVELINGLDLSNLTNWFEVSPPISTMIHPSKYWKEHSANVFSEDHDQDLEKDKILESPSFQLMGSDTSDKTYLAVDKIKYSVSDLSSQSRKTMNDEIEWIDCGAKKQGNMIKFTHCPGEVSVVSIVGTQKMTCREIELRSFTGPIILISSKCTQAFEFDRDCSEKLSAGYVTSDCKEKGLILAIIIQSVVLVIIIIALVVIIPCILKVKKGLKTTEGPSIKRRC